MSNKKKNKRVGQGMKPRTPQTEAIGEVKPVELTGDPSAATGQADGQNEGVGGEPETVETGGRLEEIPVQILDSAETADVAANPLKLTVDESSVVIGLPEGMTPETSMGYVSVEDQTANAQARAHLEGLMGKPTQQMKDENPLIVVDRATGAMGVFSPGADHDDQLDAAMLAATDQTSVNRLRLGQRSDGTFGLIITIPEGLIEPIRQQAEADGVTPETWMSTRTNEYLESWWSAPKGR